MGAGKEAPPAGAGGDGAAKEAAAPAPEPVVLRMFLHCEGCAKKVKKSIHRMPGVASVTADVKANTVVVAGTADAAALKARIESKTNKPVEIVSAGGSAKPPPAEPKKNPDKDGGEQKKKSPDTGGAADSSKGAADKGAGSGSSSQPKEAEKGKKQPPPEEKKPVEETREALLRIRLHCDGCADRIRRRIYKIKGVKDVVMEGNAKDEVKVVGTMDVPAMVAYLNEKLNRAVEAVAPSGKKGGEEASKKDKGAGEKQQKDKSAGDGAHKEKGKGVEVAGPSMASAAASMAPAPASMASTHHVSPYGYGHVAYPPPPQQGPPPGYYSSSYYGGGNADGAGYATPYYQQQPTADAGSYYHQPRSADAGSYYQHQPSADANAGSYYQHPGGYGGYGQHPNPQSYPASYNPFDTAPPPQMFSDENPNSCSVM